MLTLETVLLIIEKPWLNEMSLIYTAKSSLLQQDDMRNLVANAKVISSQSTHPQLFRLITSQSSFPKYFCIPVFVFSLRSGKYGCALYLRESQEQFRSAPSRLRQFVFSLQMYEMRPEWIFGNHPCCSFSYTVCRLRQMSFI